MITGQFPAHLGGDCGWAWWAGHTFPGGRLLLLSDPLNTRSPVTHISGTNGKTSDKTTCFYSECNEKNKID